MAKWVKVLMFMNDMNANWTQSPDFTRFSFKDGIHDFDILFEKDKPNYGYEAIKLKKNKDKINQKFNEMSKKMGGGEKDETAEGKLNRSVEALSDSDDDEPPAKGSPAPKGNILPAEVTKPQESPQKTEPEKKGGWGFFGW